ncbi:MAG: hypothetical protein K0Q59_4254 [Paenibacillus sp.]|jgi:hypothetical protein|nr:hypothetical protein [Paenibacillus sp.]
MKRFIPTIVLVVVCIGAFWYASSKNFFKEEDTTVKPMPLMTIKKEDISGIAISQGGVELKKGSDGKWALAKPEAYPTNAYSGDSWTGAFAGLIQDGEIDANPTDLSKFGLSSPSQEFTATMADGSTKTVQIGAALPIAGHYYGKLKDQPNVYKISEEQLKPLQKTPEDFTDKSPFQMLFNEVTNVQMDWKGANRGIQKADTTKDANQTIWRLGGQELKGPDAESILDKILLMSSEEMVQKKSDIKMDAPEMKLVIKSLHEGKEVVSSYIGKIIDADVWIADESKPWAFTIPVGTIQELFDKFHVPAAAK